MMMRLYPLILLIPILVMVTSCRSSSVKLNAQQKQIADASAPTVDKYLAQKIEAPGFGGEVFCSHKVLDIEDSGERIEEYVFALCQEYGVRNGSLHEGTGAAMPVAIELERQGQEYKVVNHQTPGDSPRYEGDVKRMFPEKTHDEIFYGDRKELIAAVQQKARAYYGVQ